MANPNDSQDSDPFASLHSLEDTYQAEGHALGLADGARQGRTEGRVFGLEKGFEKFLEMGKLKGRSDVVAARFGLAESGDRAAGAGGVMALEGERLRRHVEKLEALTDPGTFSTENEEDEVEAFEQRVRDARGKVRVVERIVGEGDERVARAGASGGDSGEERQAKTRREGARVVQRREDGAGGEGGGKASEMEDFGVGKARK
ncbi:hypothetical protein MBLNU230_g5660t1 [Neophaeotheca triangularis]